MFLSSGNFMAGGANSGVGNGTTDEALTHGHTPSHSTARSVTPMSAARHDSRKRPFQTKGSGAATPGRPHGGTVAVATLIATPAPSLCSSLISGDISETLHQCRDLFS
jgi:hypothetical protein